LLENNFIDNDNQFEDLINNFCLITPTNQIVDLQQLLAQINSSWQNCNNCREKKIFLDILQIRKHTNEMQLIAYRWKNFYLLNSTNINQQRKIIYEELTTVWFRYIFFSFKKYFFIGFFKDQNILAIEDSTSTMITDKIINLEQTVVQRLRWAAGANPLVQDVLIKFEIRQKERMNEIDVCREKSFFLFLFFF
jgi:hypothetical protein